jgi:hypothetical protein
LSFWIVSAIAKLRRPAKTLHAAFKRGFYG